LHHNQISEDYCFSENGLESDGTCVTYTKLVPDEAGSSSDADSEVGLISSSANLRFFLPCVQDQDDEVKL